MIETIQQHAPSEFAAGDDVGVLEILNTSTLRMDDGGKLWTFHDFLERLPSSEIADAIGTLQGIASGEIELHPLYVAEITAHGMSVLQIQTLADYDLRAIMDGGLPLSDTGVQTFLRAVGLVNIADLGVWYTSLAQVELGRDATLEDVQAARKEQATTVLRTSVADAYNAVIASIEAGDVVTVSEASVRFTEVCR